MKTFFIIFFSVTAALASPNDEKEFARLYPKACLKNTKFYAINGTNTTLAAVQKCVDENKKEINFCKLGSKCDGWYYELYLKKNGQFGAMTKTHELSSAEPGLSFSAGVLSLQSKFNFGSSLEEHLKYRLDGNDWKLIGIENTVIFNAQLTQDNDSAYASDFSVNTLTGKTVQIDHYEGNKTQKLKCKMKLNLKNLKIQDVVNTSIDNLQCSN